MQDYDRDKVDEVVLALLLLTLHDENRAWKGFDWEVLERLAAKGWIDDPRNKAKSVRFTADGITRAASLFGAYFGASPGIQQVPPKEGDTHDI